MVVELLYTRPRTVFSIENKLKTVWGKYESTSTTTVSDIIFENYEFQKFQRRIGRMITIHLYE